MIVNVEHWQLCEKAICIITYLINGNIYVPFAFLWLIDRWYGVKGNFMNYLFLFLCFISLLFLGEYVLFRFEVFKTNDWNSCMAALVWLFLAGFIFIAQKLFRRLLKKEGGVP